MRETDRENSGYAPRTLKEWFNYGKELLAEAGVREADTDAYLLLEYAANITRSYYYLHMHSEMDPQDAELYGCLLRRRAAREPVQYLTGEAPFYGRMFYVDQHVLIPRQDTEILVEEAEKRISSGMSVLDLCTGSGCILLTLAAGHRIRAVGTDISQAALAVAERNRKRLGVRANWIESDLFARIGGQFDMIVSNPPYIAAAEFAVLDPEVRDHEPYRALDGGRDGMDHIRKIIALAPDHLLPEGWLLTEIGCSQGDAAAGLMRDAGFKDVQVVKDLEKRDRVVIGKK